MLLGISTACFFPLETEAAFLLIAKNGADCAEIFFNAERELKDSFTDIICEISKEYGCRITSLHPMLSMGEPYLVFSPYIRRFEESREKFKQYYDIANKLSAKVVNLHGDRPNGKLTPEEYCERYYILNSDAKEQGVTLCQENVNGYRAGDPEFISEMVSVLGEQVRFTLDIKQCIRSGHTVNEIMKSMNMQIENVHISDHNLGSDCLLPFNGGFDFIGFTEKLHNNNYHGNCIIEVYNDAYKSYNEIYNSYNLLKSKIQP